MNQTLFSAMPKPGKEGCFFAKFWPLLLLALFWACAAGPAQAALITPYLTFSAGWNDNIRLTEVPRSDFFFKAGPGIRGYWKWPEQELTLSAYAAYAQYFSLADLSGFDSANVGINYLYTPSPRWSFSVVEQYTSTFDKPELSDTGELIGVRGGTGRLDRNTLTMTVIHRYSQFNRWEAGYTNTFTKGEDEDNQDTVFHRVRFSWSHRLGPMWEMSLGGSGVHTTYSDTPDENRGRGFARLTRLMGPNLRIWAEGDYAMNRTAATDQETEDTRNYEQLNFSAGISHNVTPRLDYQFSAGWSHVFGNNSSNNGAAGQSFPLLNAKIKYTGQRYTFSAYALADLGQFDYLGDNRGLAVSHRVGVSFVYRLAPKQDLNFSADYSRNDYVENEEIDIDSTQGVVNNYRFTARWNWQVHPKWRMSLEYYYLRRDSEQNNDDRQQNQVLLMLYTDFPFRW